MITRLRGQLVEVTDGQALLEVGAITYQLFIPAADMPALLGRVGEEIELHTLHYLDGGAQGTTLTPRLIGFAEASDRAFFELFTTVKGVGNRKALRALVRPCGELAAAIASSDTDALTALPEIGTRTAQTIIAELSGKVDAYVDAPLAAGETVPPFAEDAVTILVQMGESHRGARDRVRTALRGDPNIESADQLVEASFQERGTA